MERDTFYRLTIQTSEDFWEVVWFLFKPEIIYTVKAKIFLHTSLISSYPLGRFQAKYQFIDEPATSIKNSVNSRYKFQIFRSSNGRSTNGGVIIML